MKYSWFATFALLCVVCILPAEDKIPAPIEPREVIAVFHSSMPAGAEKKVARGHKLEFVRWLDIGSAKAALYRIIDGRAPAEVLAALKRDPHVSAAQRNKRYSMSPH